MTNQQAQCKKVIQHKAIKRALRRLINAEIADSWKGSKMPEDHPAIERELKNAKVNFDKKLEEAIFGD